MLSPKEFLPTTQESGAFSAMHSVEMPQRRNTFSEYFEQVRQHPQVVQTAHQRIYAAIEQRGFAQLGLSPQTQMDVQSYFKAAAQQPEMRRRIVVLVGEKKDTLDLTTWLKENLEAHSRTDQGALYAIDGCPMQEEPLHLIPKSMRSDITTAYGIPSVEGDLCDHCEQMVYGEYQGQRDAVGVGRIYYSPQGVGMRILDMTEVENRHMERLIGSESEPGALQEANRGVMEFTGLFGVNPVYAYPLLNVTEQVLKTPRTGLLHLDAVLITHATPQEVEQVVGQPTNEALRDRLYPIKVN